MELDREVVPVRSTARPVRASYALPEESIILVLDAVELLLLLTPEDVLPDTAERVLAVDDLPDNLELEAAVEVLFAELVR